MGESADADSKLWEEESRKEDEVQAIPDEEELIMWMPPAG
jgi:hypothetical protein